MTPKDAIFASSFALWTLSACSNAASLPVTQLDAETEAVLAQYAGPQNFTRGCYWVTADLGREEIFEGMWGLGDEHYPDYFTTQRYPMLVMMFPIGTDISALGDPNQSVRFIGRLIEGRLICPGNRPETTMDGQREGVLFVRPDDNPR